jgi:hypothetical protein
MKGDFSRSTFDPARHFTSVRMQQGRMQLDADWNEQMDILLYLLRAQASDLLGPYGAPAGSAGFAIAAQEIGEGQADLAISAGRYYVDGFLAQNEKNTLFSAQPYGGNALLPENVQVGDRFVAYLDVWERHLSGAEAPSLLEPALNGLDTTTRVQTVWQVKLWQGPSRDAGDPPATDQDMIDAWQAWREQETQPGEPASRASLQPRVTAAGYGLTNQLYRVEVHNAGQEPTVKWSRDNGSVTFVVAALALNEDKTLLTVTLEDLHTEMPLQSDDWLELTDASFEFSSQPGLLFQVQQIPGRNRLSAELVLAPGAVLDEENAQRIQAIAARLQNPQSATGQTRTILRRWDYHEHMPGVSIGKDGALQVQEGFWLPLENGIEVRFANTSRLRTGDYWLLPARSEADGYTLLWETEPPPAAVDGASTGQPTFAPLAARSVDHHYAPLAILSHDGAHWQVSDRRTLFRALAHWEAEEVDLDRKLEKAIDDLRSDFERRAAGTLATMHALQDEMFGSMTYGVTEPGVTLEPGQVAALDPATGGVRLATRDNAALVVGIVQGPAEASAGAHEENQQSYIIAQRGHRHCLVVGRVEPGDLLVPSDTPGCAAAAGLYIQPGTVIGKALQSHRPANARQCTAIPIIVTLQ